MCCARARIALLKKTPVARPPCSTLSGAPPNAAPPHADPANRDDAPAPAPEAPPAQAQLGAARRCRDARGEPQGQHQAMLAIGDGRAAPRLEAPAPDEGDAATTGLRLQGA